MIHVTKPFLPPRKDFDKILDDIWNRAWLTNNGPVLNELELKLKKYLGIDHLLITGNGTIALQIALKALDLSGEIITTPFSYVATTGSIVWENCTPVFVDIDAEDFNIDPELIAKSITPNTVGIMATHVFGNACRVDRIAEIAQAHDLRVIYDAAHCFGTRYRDKTIFSYGDISTVSFHATKVFNTVEGGAVFTRDAALLKTMAYLRNFGHETSETFASVGINGKNSEFHAAMGLAVLPYMDEVLATRKEQWQYYSQRLSAAPLQQLKITEGCDYNYSYFPVIFESPELLEKTVKALNVRHIYPRRYFRPALNTLHYVKGAACPVAERISDRVLTLPLFHDLTESEQEMIVRIVLRTLRYDD